MVEALFFIGICTIVYFNMKIKKSTLTREEVNESEYLNKDARDRIHERIKEMEEDRLKNTDIVNWGYVCICGEPTDYRWPDHLNNILYDTHEYPMSISVRRHQLQELKMFVPRDKELFNYVCGECGDAVVGIRCISEK